MKKNLKILILFISTLLSLSCDTSFIANKKEYAIVIDNNIENGNVLSNKTTAKPKERIQLTIYPDEDYILETLTLKDDFENLFILTEDSFVMPSCNAYISASFREKAKKYTVKYSTEYGTAPEEISVEENTLLSEDQLPALAEEKHIFYGWYDNDTKAEADSYKVIKDVTLTAKWTSIEHNFIEYEKTFILDYVDSEVPYKYYKCDFCEIDYDNRSNINYMPYFQPKYGKGSAAIMSSAIQSKFFETSYEGKQIAKTICIEH